MIHCKCALLCSLSDEAKIHYVSRDDSELVYRDVLKNQKHSSMGIFDWSSCGTKEVVDMPPMSDIILMIVERDGEEVVQSFHVKYKFSLGSVTNVVALDTPPMRA